MIVSDFKYKRYITGLKAGCSLFILNALFSLSYYLLFPDLNPSETAFKIHISRLLFSIAFYSIIIIFLTRKNYLILLIITILWHTLDRFYLGAQAFELNHQAWNIFATTIYSNTPAGSGKNKNMPVIITGVILLAVDC